MAIGVRYLQVVTIVDGRYNLIQHISRPQSDMDLLSGYHRKRIGVSQQVNVGLLRIGQRAMHLLRKHRLQHIALRQ